MNSEKTLHWYGNIKSMAACVQINLFFNMTEEDFLSGVEYVLRWYATASLKLKKSHNSKK